MVAAALVIFASACGLGINPPPSSPPASPTAATSRPPTPASQLTTYLEQVRPILKQTEAALEVSFRVGDRPGGGWTVAAKGAHKKAVAFDASAVDAASTVPPSSLGKAHGKLVRASRGWSVLYSDVEQNLRRRVPTREWTKSWAPTYDKAESQFNDWWFAVRVEARKLGVACPRDWRKLPGTNITSASPTTADHDLFAGRWTGTDSFGQGPFNVEIRFLGGDDYVLVGAAGQRTLLRLRDGVLLGTAQMGGKGDIKGSVRVVPASDGTLKESTTANVFGNGGDESGDVTNTVVFERSPK